MIGHHRNDRLSRELPGILDVQEWLGADLAAKWDASDIVAADGDRIAQWTDPISSRSFNIFDPGTQNPSYKEKGSYAKPCTEVHTQQTGGAPNDRATVSAGMAGTAWHNIPSWSLAGCMRVTSRSDEPIDLAIRIGIDGQVAFQLGLAGTNGSADSVYSNNSPGNITAGDSSVTFFRELNSCAFVITTDDVAKEVTYRIMMLSDGKSFETSNTRAFTGELKAAGNILLYAGDFPQDRYMQVPEILAVSRYLDPSEQSKMLGYLFDKYQQRPE